MKKTKRFFIAAFFLSLTQSVLTAQALPSVASYSLTSNDVGEHISRTVNDLVFSFIRELRTYKIIDMREENLPRNLSVPDGSDYIFYGSLLSQQDGIKLELVLKGGPLSITRSISRIYENSNRILLESRSLVRDLFDQSIALPDPVFTDLKPSATATPPTQGDTFLVPVSGLDSLAGTWMGQDDIEKVMILRGGRAVAILSSGVSLSLELTLEDSYLVIKQKGALTPRQFTNVPDSIAKIASTTAPFPQWFFLLSKDAKSLVGEKDDVRIIHDGTQILRLESIRNAVVWTRN